MSIIDDANELLNDEDVKTLRLIFSLIRPRPFLVRRLLLQKFYSLRFTPHLHSETKYSG